jgi:hypothetical protein
LREEELSIVIETECGHCGKPLSIEIDSRLRYRIREAADPWVYVPSVDFERLQDPSIIDAF